MLTRAAVFVLTLIASIAIAELGFAADELSQSLSVDKLVVVVVPPAWQDACVNWSEHRNSQGYAVRLVSPAATAVATRQRIADIAARAGAARTWIMLAGDMPPIDVPSDSISNDVYVPTFYEPSRVVINFGGDEYIATDYFYGDLNNDSISECPVGRVPANSSQQLQAMLDRSIAYETKSIPADWTHQMDLTAGIGGFSMLADMAIAGFTRALLTEALPPQFHLQMTHASQTSPYFPPPAAFRQTVIDRINRGSLLWVYVGHGHIQQLDTILTADGNYPILTNQDVTALQTSQPGSIAVMLSCYAGAADVSRDCLAEQMIRQPKGPIAAIAASRVSMPYGMSVLAQQMMHETFTLHTATLGEILCNAKSTIEHPDLINASETDAMKAPGSSLSGLIDTLATVLSPAGHDLLQERREHLWLLNLLGDPTLRMPQSESVELQCTTSRDEEGQQVIVHGQLPIAGELVVRCEYKRGRLPNVASELIKASAKRKRDEKELSTSLSQDEAMHIYHAANDTLVSEVVKATSAGDFQVRLTLPENAIGSFEVRAFVYNRNQSAVGVQTIAVAKR